MHWSTDNLRFDAEIVVEKYKDSALNIIVGNYSFIGTFDENERFMCLDCNGPPDYAKFYNGDSLFIYRKFGVTDYRSYFGKKQKTCSLAPVFQCVQHVIEKCLHWPRQAGITSFALTH